MKTYETRRESLWFGFTRYDGQPIALPMGEVEVDALIARCAAEGWRPWHMDARNVWFVREVAT